MSDNENKTYDESIYWGEDNINDSFFTAIGRVVVNFSHLEHVLTLFCGSHLGVNYPINEMITSELSFRQLINLTSSLFKEIESNKTTLKRLSLIFKELFKLEQERNKIIHSYYGASKKNNKKIVMKKITAKGKKGHFVQEDDIEVEYFNNFATQLDAISKEIVIILFNKSY